MDYYYTTGIHYYSDVPNAIARGHTCCFLREKACKGTTFF